MWQHTAANLGLGNSTLPDGDAVLSFIVHDPVLLLVSNQGLGSWPRAHARFVNQFMVLEAGPRSLAPQSVCRHLHGAVTHQLHQSPPLSKQGQWDAVLRVRLRTHMLCRFWPGCSISV